jgi:hypothetical protein
MTIRSILKAIACISVIAVAAWNIRAYTTTVLTLPPREENDLVNWERAWEPVHKELTHLGYTIGDLGYVTARSLRGEPVSESENIHRAELYYVVIPLNLIHGKIDAPFVLGDFTVERPTELPPSLVQVYDGGTGLVLLKSKAKQ